MAGQPENTPRQAVSLTAGFLSYLVPGLGQIYQGRVGKGVLFMVCLLAMFWTGQVMGEFKNVYLPDLARGGDDPRRPWDNNPWHLPKILNPLANLYHRWHFAGQFWIGISAWPALWQYNNLPVPAKETSPFWHRFQKAPRDPQDDPADEERINEYLTSNDKTPDVAWVYTVIAGVLNILVIYDAYAGPAFRLAAGEQPKANPSREEVAVS